MTPILDEFLTGKREESSRLRAEAAAFEALGMKSWSDCGAGPVFTGAGLLIEAADGIDRVIAKCEVAHGL
jgi:hypothetical protein